MLKFSGYSYLIRGQPFISGVFYGVAALRSGARLCYYAEEATARPPLYLGAGGASRAADPQRRAIRPRRRGPRVEMTLEQACPLEY